MCLHVFRDCHRVSWRSCCRIGGWPPIRKRVTRRNEKVTATAIVARVVHVGGVRSRRERPKGVRRSTSLCPPVNRRPHPSGAKPRSIPRRFPFVPSVFRRTETDQAAFLLLLHTGLRV